MTSTTDSHMHKDISFWFKWILIFLALIILGAIIATTLAGLIGKLTGVEIGIFNLKGLSPEESLRIAWVYRGVIMAQHVFIFIFPAVITMILYKNKTGTPLFHFSTRILFNAALCGVFILLAAYPLVQFGAEANKLVPLPDIFHKMEEQTAELVKLMLSTDSILILLVNIILIALVPAIGEELVFRGFLQHLLGKIIMNPHVNVWVTALIFSAIHMQFEGFIPRFILGLVLGYLMLWSGNIIYPMIAHFVNNALQIIVQYAIADKMDSISELDNYHVPLWLLVLSVLLLMLSTRLFQSYFSQKGSLT